MPNRGAENQPSYDTFTAPVVTVGTSAAALPATTPGLFYLKADSGNAGTITLGGSGVVAGTGWTLAADDVSPPIVLTSLALVYAIASQAGQLLQIMEQK